MLARLRPEMPEAWKHRPHTLLDTNNLNDVMFQYESKYPNFQYLRTLPVDAFLPSTRTGACIIGDLCKLSIPGLKKTGKTVFGAVMNLDRHNQPGSHWVAFAINVRKHAIYYYDSFGRPPPRELQQFFNKLQSSASKRERLAYVRNSVYNVVPHQKKNTECGIFACLALEALLEGRRFAEYCRAGITDDEAFAQRARLFSPT